MYYGELYPDRGGKYRWRLVANNGRKVACSGESFASAGNARKALKRFWLGMQDQMSLEVDSPNQTERWGGGTQIKMDGDIVEITDHG